MATVLLTGAGQIWKTLEWMPIFAVTRDWHSWPSSWWVDSLTGVGYEDMALEFVVMLAYNLTLSYAVIASWRLGSRGLRVVAVIAVVRASFDYWPRWLHVMGSWQLDDIVNYLL